MDSTSSHRVAQLDHPARATRPVTLARTGHRDDEQRGEPSPQNTGALAGRDALAARFSALARDLQSQPTAQGVLQHVVTAAVAVVPGAEHASITLVHRRRDVRSAAATDEVGEHLDALQHRLQQGPCLDCAYTHQTVRVDDLPHETRWPQLAAHAEELGLKSVLCLQLYVDGDDLGAINLCATAPHAFDDASEHVGLFFAAHAAVAFAAAQELTDLSAALVNRDLIGQAKGILMATYKVTAEVAFAMLSRLSQDSNRKLVEVAEAVTTAGDLH